MATAYQKAAISASKLIAAKGAVYAFERSQDSLNKVTKVNTASAPLTWDMKAVLLSARAYDRDFPQGLITGQEKVLLCAAHEVDREPNEGDKVTVKSGTWRVKAVKIVEPDGDTAIIYKLLIAKA